MRRLLHDLERATSARELKLRIMDAVPEAFGSGATGLYLFGSGGEVDEMHVRGVRDGFLLAYEQLGRESDPILARALDTRAPTHDRAVLGDAWTRSRLYRECGAPWKIKHYLCAPIVVGRDLVGTINLGRRSEQHPFGHDDVAKMNVLCARAGRRLAALRTQGDDDFGRLRAERTRLRMHIDDLERDAIPIEEAQADAVWTSFLDGSAVPIDMFDRDDRTYVVFPARGPLPAPRPPLTRRETDVVVRVAAGMANKVIAFDLGISPNTVGTTLVAARKKLGVTSRVRLVETVRRLGIS